jgi:uncharacterized tellurite resistance protein B-like protein
LSLLRFLGLGGSSSAGRDSEPESLKEIATLLDARPPEEARFVAAFSYLLARVASADLRTDDTERDAIADRLEKFAHVEPDQAKLLARTAIQAAVENSASDDHLVARAFRDMSERPERLRLLRCLYAVAAADETITSLEDNEIFEVATAIGVDRKDVVALRSEFKEHLGSMKALARER